MAKRDLYWDTLKFVLIFFVVYFHSTGGLNLASSFNGPFRSFIQLFAMPLFIFVSGRFSHIRVIDKYKTGCLRILETYIVFQFIRSIPSMYSDSFSLDSLLSFLLIPKYTLWYLQCLIYWRIFVMLIPQKFLSEKPFFVLTICFALSILGGFIPVEILSFQRAMAFLPFFFMGYYSTEIDLKGWLSKIHIGIPVISLFASYLFLYYFLNFDLDFVLHGRMAFWSYPSLSPSVMCMARCIYVLAAIFVSTMVMRLVRVQPLMAKYGGATLVIYIFHSFIVQVVKILIKQGFLQSNEVLLFVIAVVITLGLAYLSRFQIVNFMLNPVTYVKNRFFTSDKN